MLHVKSTWLLLESTHFGETSQAWPSLDLCRPSHGFQLVDLLKLLGFGKSGACHATQPRNMCGEIPSPCLFIIIHIHNIYNIYITYIYMYMYVY